MRPPVLLQRNGCQTFPTALFQKLLGDLTERIAAGGRSYLLQATLNTGVYAVGQLFPGRIATFARFCQCDGRVRPEG